MSNIEVFAHLTTNPESKSVENAFKGVVLDVTNDTSKLDVLAIEAAFGYRTCHSWLAQDHGKPGEIITPSYPMGGVARLFIGTVKTVGSSDLIVNAMALNGEGRLNIPEKSREELDLIGRALTVVTLRLYDMPDDGTYKFSLAPGDLKTADNSITTWYRE